MFLVFDALWIRSDVQNLLQSVDIRIDEQAPIDLHGWIGSEVERFVVVILGERELVNHVML